MSARIRVARPTETERAAYAATRPVYPLYGWVTVLDRRCAVEFPDQNYGDCEGPRYEVMAPKGTHFDVGEARHSLLSYDMADLTSRVRSVRAIVPCGAECEWHDTDEEVKS